MVVLSCLVLSRLVLSGVALSYLVLSGVVLSYLVLSCVILSCLAGRLACKQIDIQMSSQSVSQDKT